MDRGAKKDTSGLEKIPPIYSRPLINDRFFWITIFMVIFWTALISWFVLQ